MPDPGSTASDSDDSPDAMWKSGAHALGTWSCFVHEADLPQSAGFAILSLDLTSAPMLTARLLASLLGSVFINFNMTTCQSPGESDKVPATEKVTPSRVQLEGVSTSDLSPREEAQWSGHVSELLAPCQGAPMSIAQCVQSKNSCSACLPAAKYLAVQVRQGKTIAQVEVSYKERFSPESVMSIDLDGSPSKGSPHATITIVEWADFQCPACRAASPTLGEVVKENPDVRLVFKNFPLDSHENAELAARAALAADLQGKFWEMHDALFSSQLPPSMPTLLQFAKDLGLDEARFKKDLRSESIADAVARDRKQGDEVKLRATPTIFINGRSFSYATDLKVGLNEWIELERKLVGPPAAKKSSHSSPKGEIKDGAKRKAAPQAVVPAKTKATPPSSKQVP